MRDALKFLVAILAVLVVGGIGYRIVFPYKDVAPVLIQQVEGTVHYIGEGNQRTEAYPGQPLQRQDRVETSENGRARLTYGQHSSMQLQHGTSIRVLGITSEGVRVELDQGRVEATVRSGTESLGIVSRGREVQARDAIFDVGVNQQGTLAVETREGEVELLGMGDLDRMSEGQRITAPANGEPAMSPIPEAMLLEVAWPESARTREAEVTVRGRTDPGAEVRVGAAGRWTTVVAGNDGSFEATVPLEEGPNPLRVVSEDPLGRASSAESEVLRDTEPPQGSSFEVQY